MKNTFIFLFLLSATIAGIAQKPCKPPKMKTFSDSLGYALAFDLAKNLEAQQIHFNTETFIKGFQDYNKGRVGLNDTQMASILTKFQQQMNSKMGGGVDEVQSAENLKTGKEFLEAKKKTAGVQELEGGLLYKELKPGTGIQPRLQDQVTVNYKGSLIDGKEFDNSYKRGEPATFGLDHLIRAWQIAIPMMKEGAKWEIYVPAELGYSEFGSPPTIGPNQTLIFEIELIKVTSAN